LISGSGEFLDTNILVYAFATDSRSTVAESLLAKGCAVSVLGLNEFANVAHRKMGMTWIEIGVALASIRLLCPSVLPIDIEAHELALELAERHRLGFFDALMISSALRGGCETFWSEDMHDGLVVDGRLRVLNPFRTAVEPLG
jgi:predicted nucleic acid-binding protein